MARNFLCERITQNDGYAQSWQWFCSLPGAIAETATQFAGEDPNSSTREYVISDRGENPVVTIRRGNRPSQRWREIGTDAGSVWAHAETTTGWVAIAACETFWGVKD